MKKLNINEKIKLFRKKLILQETLNNIIKCQDKLENQLNKLDEKFNKIDDELSLVLDKLER